MRIVGLFALLFGFFCSFGQLEAPYIKYISFNPDTDELEFEWYESSSTNIVLQIIANAANNRDLDTAASGSIFSHSIPLSDLTLYSSSPMTFYVRVENGSIRSNNWDRTHTTSYLEAEFVECPDRVELSWSAYSGFGCTINRYNIFRSIDGGPFEDVGITSETTYIDTVRENGIREYYVQASFVDTEFADQTSNSNKASVTPTLRNMPTFMYANYCTVISDNELELSFTVDSDTDINKYGLFRSNSAAGTYTIVDSIIFSGGISNPILFTQTKDSIALRKNFYKLVALGECGEGLLESNVASNIMLEATEVQEFFYNLKWNGYYEWEKGASNHVLYRTIGSEEDKLIVDKFISFKEYSEYDNTANEFDLTSTVCYQVIATENKNSFGEQNTSRSNLACIEKEKRVFVPNTFNPFSGNEVNRIFKPVGKFEGSYLLTIYNRFGNIVYETKNPDEGWDGTFNDKNCLQGTYIYYLTYVDEHGNTIEQNGSVNLIFVEN